MSLIRIVAEQPNVDLILRELDGLPELPGNGIQVSSSEFRQGELGHADLSTILIDLSVGTTSGVAAWVIVERVKAVVDRARRRGAVQVELPDEELGDSQRDSQED